MASGMQKSPELRDCVHQDRAMVVLSFSDCLVRWNLEFGAIVRFRVDRA